MGERRRRDRHPDPQAVAGGQPVLACDRPRREAAGHPQGPEDVLLDVALVRRAAHDLHDEPQHVVVGVAVLKSAADGLRQRLTRQRPHAALEGAVALVVVGEHRQAGPLGQAARLMKQLADRDPLRPGAVGGREPRQVPPHRRVELDRLPLDELHHGERGEGLAEGTEHERRRGRHRCSARVSGAISPGVDDPVSLHHGERRAGHVRGAHLGRHVAIDGRLQPLGFGETIGARRRCCDDEAEQQGRPRLGTASASGQVVPGRPTDQRPRMRSSSCAQFWTSTTEAIDSPAGSSTMKPAR